jgi:hypothetical protein
VTEGAFRPAERAKQETDYGRRGKGYIFGAFRPATGAALTHPYRSRSAANWADSLGRVEAWIPADVGRVYAIVDNLQAHQATDVLLFALGHTRWQFVSQPENKTASRWAKGYARGSSVPPLRGLSPLLSSPRLPPPATPFSQPRSMPLCAP